jgi:hypothetical protein
MFSRVSRAACVVALFLSIGASSLAAEVPSITTITANGPGVATIHFKHADLFGLQTYAVQRRVGAVWEDVPLHSQVGRDSPAQKSVTATFLEPDAEHGLRLCAVYGVDRDLDWRCSGQRQVRTPPLPADGSASPAPAIIGHEVLETGLRMHFRAGADYDFYLLRWKRQDRGEEKEIRSANGGRAGAVDIAGLSDSTEYRVRVQGCRAKAGNGTGVNGTACSAFATPYRATTAFPALLPPQLDLARYPDGTRLETGPMNIGLVYIGSVDLKNTNVTLQRDGKLVLDSRVGAIKNPHTDTVPHANRVYRYQMCLIRGEKVCSQPLEARPPPVVPTPPADARVSITKRRGLRKRPPVLDAAWRNTDIPGAFVTVEQAEKRADAQSGLVADEIGHGWKEVARVDTRDDPTSLRVAIPSARGADHQANSFRVCSVVPELGVAGRVCSSAVSPAL